MNNIVPPIFDTNKLRSKKDNKAQETWIPVYILGSWENSIDECSIITPRENTNSCQKIVTSLYNLCKEVRMHSYKGEVQEAINIVRKIVELIADGKSGVSPYIYVNMLANIITDQADRGTREIESGAFQRGRIELSEALSNVNKFDELSEKIKLKQEHKSYVIQYKVLTLAYIAEIYSCIGDDYTIKKIINKIEGFLRFTTDANTRAEIDFKLAGLNYLLGNEDQAMREQQYAILEKLKRDSSKAEERALLYQQEYLK